MADNYLENQYEQYQARKAAWERERKYGKKKKEISVSASLAATEGCGRCPVRSGRGE